MQNLRLIRTKGYGERWIALRLREKEPTVRSWFQGRWRPTIKRHYDAIFGLAVEIQLEEIATTPTDDDAVVEDGRVVGLFQDGRHKSAYLVGKAILEMAGA